MSEIQKYNQAMDAIHAPESLYSEVWNMTIEKEHIPIPHIRRRIMILAAALVLMLAIGLTAYAAGTSIYGWGGNFEVRHIKTKSGERTESVLHTDSLTEPVRFENDRMIFIVNGEEIDITDKISETEPFHYAYTDEEGIIHYWIVGRNGPELTNYGYGEFLYKEGENWLGGYSARTNLDKDGKGPDWLQDGKKELNIPW